MRAEIKNLRGAPGTGLREKTWLETFSHGSSAIQPSRHLLVYRYLHRVRDVVLSLNNLKGHIEISG